MEKLRKIDAHTNVVTWFEIPVNDSKRAKEFYETILDIEMVTRSIPETGEELTFFPQEPDVIQATSGRVTGVLAKSPDSQPSDRGTMVYINAYPKLQDVLERVERAGGKIMVQQMHINAGNIAVIMDTEGNRVGLHSEK